MTYNALLSQYRIIIFIIVVIIKKIKRNQSIFITIVSDLSSLLFRNSK